MSSDVIEENPGPSRASVSPTLSSPPVAIVGMHRSGTSMVAKLLQQAGLFLGEEADLMPPAEENPEGFFEHLGFVRTDRADAPASILATRQASSICSSAALLSREV